MKLESIICNRWWFILSHKKAAIMVNLTGIQLTI